MKKNLFILSFLSLLFIFVSCERNGNDVNIEEKKVENIKLNTSILSFDDVKVISEKLKKLNFVSASINGQRVILQLSEDEIIKTIQPLIDNGTQLHLELINQLEGTEEWNCLTEIEKSELINMSDTQKAEISLFYTAYTSESFNQMQAISRETALHCLSAAVGLTAIDTIISGTAALMTVESAVAILKVAGKRMLGYVGLALAVYEFVECVS